MPSSLDRLINSSANYWAAMFGDLMAAVAFLVLGLKKFSGPNVEAVGVVDRKSTRLNSSHIQKSRMPSSA